MADTLFPDGFRGELDGVSGELERIGTLADGVARSLSNAFRGAITDGKSLNGLLGDIARSFADIALRAALKPLGNLVSGLVVNVFAATNPVVQGVPVLNAGYWNNTSGAFAGWLVSTVSPNKNMLCLNRGSRF